MAAGARYVPNTQFLSIPFRSELIHSAAKVSELKPLQAWFALAGNLRTSPKTTTGLCQEQLETAIIALRVAEEFTG